MSGEKNYTYERVGDGISDGFKGFDFALFENGKPVIGIDKEQVKELRRTNNITGILKDGVLLKKNQSETPPKKENSTNDDKKAKIAKLSSKPNSEPRNESIKNPSQPKKAKISGSKIEAPSKKTALTKEELESFKALSLSEINQLEQSVISKIRNLITRANTESEVKMSYHASTLLRILKDSIQEEGNTVFLSYTQIENLGLGRKYIKSSYNELARLNLITVEKVLYEGSVSMKFTIIERGGEKLQ